MPPDGGALLFARYALPPNALGYCGPDEARSLREHVQEGVVDPDLLAAARRFEGAWPYLALIAEQNGIADPLDRRVVEAYWIGNELLDRVDPRAFAADLERRFGSRTPRSERPWLAEPARRGLPVHHNTHVLAVMPRIGLLRTGLVPDLVQLLGHCLIRPARVFAVEPDGRLTVLARPLEFVDGRLSLGSPRSEEVALLLDGTVGSGDIVAVHWGIAVVGISFDQGRTLGQVNARAMG